MKSDMFSVFIIATIGTILVAGVLGGVLKTTGFVGLIIFIAAAWGIKKLIDHK